MSTTPTAWGEIQISIGTPGTGDIMSTTLASLGYLKEKSVSIETEKGEVIQLFGTGHVLRDTLQKESSLKLKGTLLGLTSAKQFWKFDATETSECKSLVNSTPYSVKLASLVVGSETLEAPKCMISAVPVFSEDEGWTAECEITVLKGDAGYLFKFGTVSGS